ncbi:hypothetical protein GGR92_003628 [Spirosoma lacussanchae]|uniref:hypothetical protein n=1 Tax=Spirosoma lacussanchae TaxID=1884249 RepID=UPI0011085E05|nr:hypothetical protein [Spirosoma lacussanchae]
MNLSRAKQLRVEQDIVSKEQLLHQLRKDFSLTTFEEHFSDLSAIWQAFLLHILQPATFPIFDQHVYRAYRYLTTGRPCELPFGKANRMRLYHESYLPFFNQIVAATTDNSQTTDQALWAFGKFIRQYPTFIRYD